MCIILIIGTHDCICVHGCMHECIYVLGVHIIDNVSLYLNIHVRVYAWLHVYIRISIHWARLCQSGNMGARMYASATTLRMQCGFCCFIGVSISV